MGKIRIVYHACNLLYKTEKREVKDMEELGSYLRERISKLPIFKNIHKRLIQIQITIEPIEQ